MRTLTSGVKMQPLSGSGKATRLVQQLQRREAAIILTTQCNLSCSHCMANWPPKMVHLDVALVMKTIDELEGIDILHLSGGEPSLHPSFMAIVQAASEHASRVYVNTNGTLLPSDLHGARIALRRFPKNTTFVLSVDRYHAAALQRIGRDYH